MFGKKKEITRLYKDAMIIHLTRNGYSSMRARIMTENIFNNYIKNEVKGDKLWKGILLDIK